MTDEEYMRKEHERNVKAFARKFMVEHESEIINGDYDYSDAALKETFKDCALPLRSIFYDECRAEIDKLIDEMEHGKKDES